MYVITLSYTASLEQIDEAIPAHREWLDGLYAEGVVLASGAQIPRNGGVILAAGLPREALEARLAEDPFVVRGLCTHTVIEFHARKTQPGLEALQG